MKQVIFLTLAVTLAGPAVAASPIAEILCAPRDELVQKLTTQFSAQQTGIGMRDPDSVMEVWTSDRSGEWTLVLSYTDGNSCIVAMGQHWQAVENPA